MRIRRLLRNRPCVLFDLGKPIWNGGRRYVGLDSKRIGADNEIVIRYRRKSDGELSFPDRYYFDGTKCKTIDYKPFITHGQRLLLIPFTDLEILQRVDKLAEEGSFDELMEWLDDDRYAKNIDELNAQEPGGGL